MKPMDEAAPGRIGASIEDCRVPERFRFAPTAYNSNPNMAEIPTLLGGGDMELLNYGGYVQTGPNNLISNNDIHF